MESGAARRGQKCHRPGIHEARTIVATVEHRLYQSQLYNTAQQCCLSRIAVSTDELTVCTYIRALCLSHVSTSDRKRVTMVRSFRCRT